jgi:hypothetical protein
MFQAYVYGCATALCLTLALPATAQITAKPTAASFAELAKLPDFGGVWEVTRGPAPAAGGGNAARPAPPEQPSLTAKYAEKLAAYRAHPPQDSVAANCVPPGMPGVMSQPYPLEFILSPGKVTVIAEAYMQVRHIYTDGRPHPEDPDLTFNGHSIGKWDKDTLIVDSIGFSPLTSLGPGIEHSDKMHIVERMRLSTPDNLEIVTTVDDKEALTKPFTRTANFGRHRDWVTAEYICQENNRNSVDESGKAGINLKVEGK